MQSLWVYWFLLLRHTLAPWSLYIAPVAFIALTMDKIPLTLIKGLSPDCFRLPV